MLIAFANNQSMAALNPTPSVICTDPVALNGDDRVAVHLFCESIFNPLAASGLTYLGQVSNDGTNWVDIATLTDFADAVTTVPKAKVIAVNGAFLRFRFTFSASAGNIGGCTFDLHVLTDKS